MPNNRAYFGTPLFHQLDHDKRYVAEVKRNGWRCLAIKIDGKMQLWTRHATLIFNTKNSKLEGVRSSLENIPNNSFIDGELLDRRDRQGRDLRDTFYAFDILWWDNKSLWQCPLWQRREALESVLQTNNHIMLAEQYKIGRALLYTRAIEGGDEGIVFKRKDSIYLFGMNKEVNNPLWVKIKKDEKSFVNQEANHG